MDETEKCAAGICQKHNELYQKMRSFIQIMINFIIFVVGKETHGYTILIENRREDCNAKERAAGSY